MQKHFNCTFLFTMLSWGEQVFSQTHLSHNVFSRRYLIVYGNVLNHPGRGQPGQTEEASSVLH